MSANFKVDNLFVEYTETPIGLDVKSPHFSWNMKSLSEKRGLAQSCFQITVYDEQRSMVWDSGKISSDQSVNIKYKGSELVATTRYDWTVTVWDQFGTQASETSWFETGLMNDSPSLEAWDGATWIGGETVDLPFYSDYFSVYSVSYTLRLANGSKRASFILNANDPRLMDANKNIYQMENEKNESYVKIELDVSAVSEYNDGCAKLHLYRVGFVPSDSASQPFRSIDIPKQVIDEKNMYENHQIYLIASLGVYTIYVNGREEENKIAEEIVLNPVGHNHDYLTHTGKVAEIGFSVDQGQKAYFKHIQIAFLRKPSNVIFSDDGDDSKSIFDKELRNPQAGLTIENKEYVVDGSEKGVFIVKNPSRNAMPMLRTQFQMKNNTIKKARLYATARGVYEIEINGHRVGNEYFNPGYTQYNRTHMYQTYDVTDLIKDTENAVGVRLGEGWWSGLLNYGDSWNYFGDRQSFLAKLVITFEDDTEQIITTNPNEWKYFNDGPIRYGSFFMGEVYDATKEQKIEGWSTPTYGDSEWKPAVEVLVNSETTWDGYDYSQLELIGQIGEGVVQVDQLVAKSVNEVRPGVFVYDMGQNMVGVPRITLKNRRENERITLRVAEILYPDLTDSGANVGMIMQENLRAALNQDVYICKDGDQVIEPRFTFHGYRYIEITGMDAALPLDAVEGIVISSIQEWSSSYETSNEDVNKLWENTTWSMRGNFLSIPTDTPARNERMGWNGDISVFSRTATYLSNVNQFLRRHNRANRDMQSEEGRYSDVAPVGPGFGGILWGSAGIIVPWEMYQQYGDISVLAEHYSSMQKYMNYLQSKIDQETGLIDEGPLGDWLSPEYHEEDNIILWMAYYAYNAKLMAKISEVLSFDQEKEQYESLYLTYKKFFNDTFIEKESKKTIRVDGSISDTQASYAVPLELGIIDESNAAQVAENLAQAIRRENTDTDGIVRPNYSLMTGFIGVPVINLALSTFGYHQEAYRLLQQTSYPSWLYSVKNGATTIWERLNSYTVENGFGGNNSMNSFNHYTFGSVVAWMYMYSLGIQRSEDTPAFKKFVLKPTPDPDKIMTWAKGYVDTMYGRIESEWKVENDIFYYDVVVPANTSAILYLPTSDIESIKETHTLQGVPIEWKDNHAIIKLESGTYQFESKI